MKNQRFLNRRKGIKTLLHKEYCRFHHRLGLSKGNNMKAGNHFKLVSKQNLYVYEADLDTLETEDLVVGVVSDYRYVIPYKYMGLYFYPHTKASKDKAWYAGVSPKNKDKFFESLNESFKQQAKSKQAPIAKLQN